MNNFCYQFIVIVYGHGLWPGTLEQKQYKLKVTSKLYILANLIRLAYDGEYNFEEIPISLWT